MSSSFGSPRFGLGLSEERRIAMQRVNKLKQELYAQQKKIQFSNLLERSSQDVEAYIESQDNVFIAKGRAEKSTSSGNEGAPVDVNVGYDEAQDSEAEAYYFSPRAFLTARAPSSERYFDSEDEQYFDPVAPTQETLRDHLLEQLELDGKFSRLKPEVKALCRVVIDNLDSSGYLKPDVKTDRQTQDNAASEGVDEESVRAIVEFDTLFDLISTDELRSRAKKALDDYYSVKSVSKSSRRLAREEFDAIVGRKTTKEEREIAKKALDAIKTQRQDVDPLDALFPNPPSEQERALAEEALKTIQQMDPPGVGARNMQESLILRLRPDAEYHEQLELIITRYFDDFIKKRLGALSSETGISHDELVQIFSGDFPFYPSPSELFAEAPSQLNWIQPEIVVEQNAEGRWIVKLDDSREDLELDPYYSKLLFSKRVDKKTKEYLRRQYVEAQALVDALRNRKSTLLRVAKAVVDFQSDYFDDPSSYPKPLTQQQIADKLGLDSSTISRACNNKWLATPRGFAAFRDFFPKAVVGDATSSNVAEKIRDLVANESKTKPLSDEALAAELKNKHGLEVSRKTVQEHRDRLGIPNSRERKRLAGKSK